MSLIVAYATDQGPCIVSDTRVTFPDGRLPTFKNGTLKAVVLNTDVVVCFAGDVIAGLDGIRDCGRRLEARETTEQLVSALEMRSADTRREVEFLVATNSTNNQLTRIRKGTREQSLQKAWIGEQNAFERFQMERNKPLTPFQQEIERQHLPQSIVAITRLQEAMQAVINDPNITSVDDFCVSIRRIKEGFQYLSSAFVHVGRDFTISDGDDIASMMIQGVETGGYQACVVQPTNAGTPALGLHFANARLGMLYLPLEFDEAQVINDISPNDFSRAALERYHVELGAPLIRELHN